MSTTAAAVTVVVFLVVVLTAAHWVICRLRRAASTRDRLIREAHQRADSYEGPDSLRLLEDLEAHMKAYGKAVADLYEPVGPSPGPDPMWDAGCERLWDAVRDNQNQQGGPQ